MENAKTTLPLELERASTGDVRLDVSAAERATAVEPVYVELQAEPEPKAEGEKHASEKHGAAPEAADVARVLEGDVKKTESVLGKRDRQEPQVLSRGGETLGEKVTPHREEESKRRRTSLERAGAEPTGAAVGFKGLDDLDLDIEGVRREKRSSPEKKQQRLQKIREKLGKGQGSPSSERSRKVEAKGAEKPSVGGELRGVVRDTQAADLDALRERAVPANERAPRGAASPSGERKKRQGELEKRGGFQDGQRLKTALESDRGGVFTAEKEEYAQGNITQGQKRERDVKGEDTRDKRDKKRISSTEEVARENLHQGLESGRDVKGDETRDKKRKHSREEKGAAKREKRMKALDALPDVAGGPQPKEEPPAQLPRATAEVPVMKPFKIKIKIKPPI